MGLTVRPSVVYACERCQRVLPQTTGVWYQAGTKTFFHYTVASDEKHTVVAIGPSDPLPEWPAPPERVG